MFPKSISWRLQVWLAFLLVFILAALGVAAYQLQKADCYASIDEELQKCVAAVGLDLRGQSPPGMPGEPPPFERGRDGLPFEPGREGPGFDRGHDGPGFERGRDGPFFEPGRGGPALGRFGREPRGPRGRLEDFFEGREVRLSEATTRLLGSGVGSGYYFAVWSRGGSLLKRSTNGPARLERPALEERNTRIQLRTEGLDRQAFQFTDIGESVLVGRSIATDLAALRRYGWLLVAAGAVVLALGLGGGWLLTTRALRPVQDISDAAIRIAEGNLSQRINVAETDSELGRLAGVLNSTFARLEMAFGQQLQFTADASHELRTPIAVILAEAQTALARERSAAEYREALEGCLDAAQQMRRLAQSLLELARYDAGQETIEREPFDLAEQARTSVDLVRPLAERQDVNIQCDLTPASVRGDAARIGQVVTNLLTNALHYSRKRGTVTVKTAIANGHAVLTVADTGEGIAPEDLPRIFERFYRADKSRARAHGHAGLGLAISKAIVDAHGGSIEATSELGKGTLFAVRLPAN